MREINFDGLVGPTHNYAGLSRGNLASSEHSGRPANPRAAALQGLAKMELLHRMGVGQAVLPPQPRPDVRALRALGLRGTDDAVLRAAARDDGHLLRLCSSASSMWTANAATVAPSADTVDGRMHLAVANLSAMFHRSLEAATTHRVFSAIFSDPRWFEVHAPLPSGSAFSDEGAANHLRLKTTAGTTHVFAWGRSGFEPEGRPARFPRRQTREASAAVARLLCLRDGLAMPWEQDPAGIDLGAFHTDVLATGNESFLMLHEHAFSHHRDLVAELRRRLGDELSLAVAHESELPVRDAVSAYPFNSQIVTLPDGTMRVIAPTESRDSDTARRFLERVVAGDNPVRGVEWVDVNASMENGGGPACLRLRIPLEPTEIAALAARVLVDDVLLAELRSFVERHYRDRLVRDDLADPALLVEVRTALDELSRILSLGSVFDFQRP
ncbi:MAG TPA: N-succinylarginine dihydrolase [Polyangiaceae bacterium]|nr:N-succinylarginine dihydrolase [Polyangiaceae bacterium]